MIKLVRLEIVVDDECSLEFLRDVTAYKDTEKKYSSSLHDDIIRRVLFHTNNTTLTTEDCDDVASNAIIKIYRLLKNGKTLNKTYIVRVIKNEICDAFAKQRRLKRLDENLTSSLVAQAKLQSAALIEEAESGIETIFCTLPLKLGIAAQMLASGETWKAVELATGLSKKEIRNSLREKLKNEYEETISSHPQ
jgi:hypothetical protein